MKNDIQVRPEEGVEFRRIFEDGRTIDMCRMIYNWRLRVGHIKDPWGYEDDWCFANQETAMHAFLNWSLEGEPEGWIKHPRTGRYRPGGDPAKEFNQREATPAEQFWATEAEHRRQIDVLLATLALMMKPVTEPGR